MAISPKKRAQLLQAENERLAKAADNAGGSDSAYTKYIEQKLGRSSIFKICDVR